MSPEACSRTRFIRRSETTTSREEGGAPQPSLVPLPRGATTTPFSFAQRRIEATCSWLAGSTTRSGKRPQTASPASAWAAGAMVSRSLQAMCGEGMGTPAIRTTPPRPPLPADAVCRDRASRRRASAGETPCRDWPGGSGSKAQRTNCMVSRSGSAYISAMNIFFSSPTPCSPVMEPPAWMQSRRMSAATASASFSWPGMRPS